MHDTMVLDHWRLFDFGYVIFAKMLFSLSAKNSTVVVTPSEHSKRQITRRWPHLDVRVIPWPTFRARASAPRSAPGSNEIVLIASCDKHKRIPMAIRSVDRARRLADGHLRLTIVGKSGNDVEAITQAISEVDGGWLTWIKTGVPQKDLDTLISEAFCVLSTSLDEGFCLPLLEAGSAGVPVVHTGRGAMPEVVGQSPLGDQAGTEEDQIALRLVALLDRPTWAGAARRAHHETQRFSPSVFESQWGALLNEVATRA
ncbi:glycosyltransferase [Nocardioides mesophilus]|uniref:Glycosyltransferase n=2 Tax=Nocardioides mesophilus TaxID=433659 RepID=A0A7G9REF7_9ACTN|nr:glycosyltransferase [Nocardioides mesophilus]